PRVLRRARHELSSRRELGAESRARDARRDAASGSPARSRRRQVAGGIFAGVVARQSAFGRPRSPAPGEKSTERSEGAMAKIIDVRGRKVWDSRGRATVEAEVVVGRGTTPLATGRAIAPAGASTGAGEAKAIDAAQAVQNINT